MNEVASFLAGLLGILSGFVIAAIAFWWMFYKDHGNEN